MFKVGGLKFKVVDFTGTLRQFEKGSVLRTLNVNH